MLQLLIAISRTYSLIMLSSVHFLFCPFAPLINYRDLKLPVFITQLWETITSHFSSIALFLGNFHGCRKNQRLFFDTYGAIRLEIPSWSSVFLLVWCARGELPDENVFSTDGIKHVYFLQHLLGIIFVCIKAILQNVIVANDIYIEQSN